MSAPTSFDVIILGTGPAGLQAAVHAARRKVSVLVLGQIQQSSLYKAHIDNYFSLFQISGEELLRRGMEQVTQAGAVCREESVTGIEAHDAGFVVRTDVAAAYVGKSLVLATGSKRNRLGVPGEKELLGKGVSYCVDCDGFFFKGRDVCVVGNESAAVDGVLTLTRYAGRVHWVCDAPPPAGPQRERADASGAIIHQRLGVEAIEGTEQVTGVRLSNGTRLAVEAVFIELGAKGVLELATPLGVMLDESMTFIQTDRQQQTSVPGVFAAGDICGMPWQLAKAVGEGCIAGIGAAGHARQRGRRAPG
jgi:thioredoxin reductase (NADPH)